MRQCGKWPIGIASWSYRLGIRGLADMMSALEIEHIQLQLQPALKGDAEWLAFAAKRNWKIVSTMFNFDWEDYSTPAAIRATGGVIPDAHWDEAQRLFVRGIDMTASLGCANTLMHIGHVDYADEGLMEKMRARTRVFADIAAAKGVTLLLETGLESGADLRRFLGELNHPALAVNFDPANLLSYHKDTPLGALGELGAFVRSVHAKDVIPGPTPGVWGEEKVFGDGEVNAYRLLGELDRIGFDGPVIIEREYGEDPIRDAARAIRRLEAFR